MNRNKKFGKIRTLMFFAAMGAFPAARKNELSSLNRIVSKYSNKNKLIYESNCGSGYATVGVLVKHLKKNGRVFASDNSFEMLKALVLAVKRENLTRKVHAYLSRKGEIPLHDKTVDLAVSFAGFHHIPNKDFAVGEMSRVLKQGGYLIIGDVHEKTPTQAFFDDIPRRYCITGHSLPFLNKKKIQTYAKRNGLEVVESKIYNVPWTFNDSYEAIYFIKNIHGLDIINRKLLRGINKHHPLQKKGRRVALPWELAFVVYRKR